MIEEIMQIEDDWYLIHLKGTRYFQIWNKWDLFDLLLNVTQTDLNNPPKPYMVLMDEDLPIPKEGLNELVNKLKQNKEVWKRQRLN
jgi:hypothetical protein